MSKLQDSLSSLGCVIEEVPSTAEMIARALEDLVVFEDDFSSLIQTR